MTEKKHDEIVECKQAISHLKLWITNHGNKGTSMIENGGMLDHELEDEMREAVIGLAFVELDKLEEKWAAL